MASEASPEMTAETQIKADLKGGGVKKVIGLLIRYLVPLALTVLLVWYMFRKIDFAEMMQTIREGVDYWWILLAMVIGLVSHVFRAARWRLQLRSLGIDAPFMALCCSIFGCYALNLIFPRLGEVWRCTYIAKRQKAPFTTVLGSMVADRLSDTLMVLLLLLLTFILANEAINAFLTKYPVGRDFMNLVTDPLVWCICFGALVVVGGCFFFLRNTSIVKKILKWFAELWQGFAVVWKMKGKFLFVVLTLCIWGSYYIQLYFGFYAFDFLRALCRESSLGFGFVPCLVAFVLSSIGMAIPSNGGLGPWNIAVIFGLAVYGISDADGTAFSMVQWSAQTLLLIILGIYTMVYMAYSKAPGDSSGLKISPTRHQTHTT